VAVQALAPMTDDAPACDDGLLRVTVRERTGAIVEAVRRLDDAGVGVEDLVVRRPTLDDVFLTLTGHAAEHAGGDADDRPT
jgi:ABC-2 type transport system ATP-binding protein